MGGRKMNPGHAWKEILLYL